MTQIRTVEQTVEELVELFEIASHGSSIDYAKLESGLTDKLNSLLLSHNATILAALEEELRKMKMPRTLKCSGGRDLSNASSYPYNQALEDALTIARRLLPTQPK